MEQIYDWLVVFFIHEIPGFAEDYSNKILNNVKKAGFGKQNKIFLIKDIFLKQDETTVTFDLQLFVLDKTSENKYKFNKVDNAEIESPDKNSWKAAFKYIYTNFKSKRKMLLTWSHGAAFGINDETLIVKRSDQASFETVKKKAFQNIFFSSNPSKKLLLFKPKSYYVRNDNFLAKLFPNNNNNLETMRLNKMSIPSALMNGKILKDNNNNSLLKVQTNTDLCKSLEILWISDLAETLSEYLPQKEKVDMLIMTNCYLQLFENGYMLKDKVNYFIGAETYMYANGYDFKKMMLTINSQPDIDVAIFSKSIVCDYIKLNQSAGETYYLNQTSLFANCLENDSEIFLFFDKIVILLIEHFSEMIGDLKNVRENFTYIVSNEEAYPVIDLTLWIKLVLASLENKLKININDGKFLGLMDERVIAAHIGNFFTNNDKMNAKKYGSSGASLYYPMQKPLVTTLIFSICAYFDDNIKSIFKSNSHWDEFIHLYTKATSLPGMR